MTETAPRARILAIAGLGALTIALIHAFWAGDFRETGTLLLQRPWGVATLVDVYVGLALFSAWVVYREASGLQAGVWVLAFLTTGNLATCCYVLRAAATSGGSAAVFWRGGHNGS